MKHVSKVFGIIAMIAVISFVFAACENPANGEKKKAKTYTVTFDSNEGTAVAAKTVTEGGTIAELPSSSREGYSFEGWFTDKDVWNDEFTSSTVVNASITVFAKWEKLPPDTYSISYNLNGGSNDSGNPATYTEESETITLKAPSRANYTFDGWFDNADFNGDAVTAIAQGSTGNKTLYAKWSPIPYSITYNLDGGTNDSGNPDSYTIETETITLNAPSKTGFLFVGWFDNAEFDGTAVTSIAKGSTGNKTLYAKWMELPSLVFVEGGIFSMGSDSGVSDERPVHNVTISSFYMGKYEVTQAQWEAVMDSNPSYSTGENLPVETVSWYDAILYCNRLSLKENLTPAYSVKVNGNEIDWETVNAPTSSNADWAVAVMVEGADGYRLPTEAEWEYAAKGGNKDAADYIYSGSDDVNIVAWYVKNSGGYEPHDVGTKAPNSLGIYDMSGNVTEWCWDWYGAYSSDAQTDPAGASSGWSLRVMRGGSIYQVAQYMRSTSRLNNTPTYRSDDLGFRLVRPSA